MTERFVTDGPDNARATFLFAHGAGAPMDSNAMTMFAEAMAARSLRVMRFEFAYMAARRRGVRKPPPRAETLLPEFWNAVEAIDTKGILIIGGKSMGGRVASMAADELHAAGSVAGLVCLGYPFHPPKRPDAPRTAHLQSLKTPALICQGTRDPFGTKDDVAGYRLSPRVELFWMEDGDHDLKPRKKVTGLSAADYAVRAAGKIADWTSDLASARRT